MVFVLILSTAAVAGVPIATLWYKGWLSNTEGIIAYGFVFSSTIIVVVSANRIVKRVRSGVLGPLSATLLFVITEAVGLSLFVTLIPFIDALRARYRIEAFSGPRPRHLVFAMGGALFVILVFATATLVIWLSLTRRNRTADDLSRSPTTLEQASTVSTPESRTRAHEGAFRRSVSRRAILGTLAAAGGAIVAGMLAWWSNGALTRRNKEEIGAGPRNTEVIVGLPGTWVIAAPCIGKKAARCVAVCPPDAIVDAGDQFVIDPDECIGCGACKSECPVSAIFEVSNIPSQWAQYIEKNRERSFQIRAAQRRQEEELKPEVRQCDTADVAPKDHAVVEDRLADIEWPRHGLEAPFLMTIDDVYTLSGRGAVVYGRVDRGSVTVGDEVELVGLGSHEQRLITGISGARGTGSDSVDRVCPGEQVGLLLRGLGERQVDRAQVLAAPGSIRAWKRFKARVFLLPQERARQIFNGYSPQFLFRTRDVSGVITLPPSLRSASAGDIVTCHVELREEVALENGLRFALREIGRTIGMGAVIETY